MTKSNLLSASALSLGVLAASLSPAMAEQKTDFKLRITSYNVCYTKLLRLGEGFVQIFRDRERVPDRDFSVHQAGHPDRR